MTRVEPDGPVPSHFAVVGEGPASEEVRQGRGFVGPSGALLWPLMRRLAGLDRSDCYVTNLSKTRLDDDESGDAKLSPEDFDRCRRELWAEMERVRPQRILAVGALAAKALLGERYTSMECCNGVGFPYAFTSAEDYGAFVVPTWHPAASLRPGGEDRLAYTGAAIAALVAPTVCPAVAPEVPVPEVVRGVMWGYPAPVIGIDTEGWPDDPICMTAATATHRWYMEPVDVPEFFRMLPDDAELWFHNAPWDWQVLWAMGAPADIASRWRWRDTMELAYLRQTEPKGLKDLAYRHLGLRMRTYDEVVTPYYNEVIQAVAAGRVEAGTTYITHSPKTGKLLKKPKVRVTEEMKPIKRVLGNPKLLAERMPGLPASSLRLVPERERVEYATLDAWATLKVKDHLL